MVHPLSSEKEIEFCLKESASVVCLTLDQIYGKFENIRQQKMYFLYAVRYRMPGISA